MLTIYGPLNKLSYGRVTVKIIQSLITDFKIPVSVIPIGPIELEQDEIDTIHIAINTPPNFSAPIIKIWHANDMSVPIEFTGPKFGFTIFELIDFSQTEKDQLKSVNVINCSEWARLVCKYNGVENTAGIVNLGVDTDVFKPSDYTDDTFDILIAGKAEIRKGHNLVPAIINKFLEVSKLKTKLHCCIHNPFYNPYEMDSWYRFLASQTMCDVVIYNRFDTQAELAALMQKMDVGLFPAKSEGWNLELMEMMACGKHVVTTHYSGHTEYINSTNSHSVLIDTFEPAVDSKWFFGQSVWAHLGETQIEKLAEKLLDISKKKNEANLAGVFTAQQYSWSNSAKQLLQIIGVSNV